jgi:hypothetical protein
MDSVQLPVQSVRWTRGYTSRFEWGAEWIGLNADRAYTLEWGDAHRAWSAFVEAGRATERGEGDPLRDFMRDYGPPLRVEANFDPGQFDRAAHRSTETETAAHTPEEWKAYSEQYPETQALARHFQFISPNETIRLVAEESFAQIALDATNAARCADLLDAAKRRRVASLQPLHLTLDRETGEFADYVPPARSGVRYERERQAVHAAYRFLRSVTHWYAPHMAVRPVVHGERCEFALQVPCLRAALWFHFFECIPDAAAFHKLKTCDCCGVAFATDNPRAYRCKACKTANASRRQKRWRQASKRV